MIAGKVTVSRRDNGLAKFLRNADALAKSPSAVTVGVHGDASGSYDNGPGVLEIATWHEFGIGNPQRSFIRAWVDEHKSDIDKVTKRYAALAAMGKTTREEALERMGNLFVASIQKRIAGGIAPPNAESTIDKKGSSTPLIDTGVLRASITFKVV